ncbi:MAG: S9 family peptidase [Gammaproteobacteria bacterium]|nr:MAG: S9 family peptidase [Gammaproteobacteria bacterium]
MRTPGTVLLASLLLIPAARATELTVERLFEAPDLGGPTLRQPRFSPDGRLVSYLRAREDDPSAYDLWAYDLAARRHRQLVDSRLLLPQAEVLSAAEEARRERQRTAALRGIVEYAWAPDSQGLLFPLGGDLYHYDLARPADAAVRRLTATEAGETDARYSPRGRYVSFVRDQDLYAVEVATGIERRLSSGGGGPISHGVAEFIAQEEMGRDTGYWWSPDERHLAFARVDETPVAEIERFEIHADGVRSHRQRYPEAGAANASVRLAILSLETGTTDWADLGPDDHYLARVHWFPEGGHLLVQRQSRDQKRLDLLDIPASGGSGRLLFTETSPTWVELHDDLHFVPGRREFLWSSARSGHNHLYRHDYDGQLLGAVTSGDWDVAGDTGEPAVRGIDARPGRVYFMATLKSPLERQLYVADLDAGASGAPRALTANAGWHSVTMSQDARRFLLHYSDPLQPPQLSLHDAAGKRLAWLIENRLDDRHPYAPYRDHYSVPEFGTLPAGDGTPLHWQLLRPTGFDPARQYPAIVLVYGGPTAQTVQRRWGDRRGGQVAQILAQRGYVVFRLDNRGSGSRGHAFASSLYRALGTVEVEDQLAGVAWLASQPWVDPARIGVQGWSYGGYMVLLLLAHAPGTFAAGVAGAPVTDWRLYDTHYTERYLGRPQDESEAYRRASVLSHAGAIRDRLLLIHGMADDNVLFTHTTQLIPVLVATGRPFEVLPYPGSRHAALSFRDTGIHGWKTILDFFDRYLVPGDGVAGSRPDHSAGD